MKRSLLHWALILGLCGAGGTAHAGVFDPASYGIAQLIPGYRLDDTGAGRTLPSVDWFSDLMEVLPDVIDIFIDDDKQRQDERDSRRDDEQAWREQQRAEQAEQEAEWQREEARRERERAEEAEQREAEAREEAQQSRELAEQAQVQEAHKRVGRQNTFVALLALLTLLALILAMRRPRQAIVRVAGNAMEPLRRSFKPAGHKPALAAPPGETARVVLTGFDGRGKPVNIPLPGAELDPKRGGFTLGRHHLLVDRVLDDEQVSKRHARFTYRGNGYFVEDLNSTNGTVINGTQICPPFRPMPVRPGDTVRLGGIELTVSA